MTAAGCSFSLYEDWGSVLAAQKYKKNAYDWSLFVVLFGYLGSNPGLVTHYLGHITAYIVAAILSLIGYIGLGYCGTFAVGSPWHLFFTLLFLYLAAFGSSIAIVASVSETLQNFSKRAGYLYIVLMIIHFLLSYSFEESLRNGILRNVLTIYYYPFLGVGVAVVYIISCVVSSMVKIEDVFKRINITEDIIGLLSLILISTILVVLNFMYYLEYSKWTAFFIMYVISLVLNFVIAYVIIHISSEQ